MVAKLLLLDILKSWGWGTDLRYHKISQQNVVKHWKRSSYYSYFSSSFLFCLPSPPFTYSLVLCMWLCFFCFVLVLLLREFFCLFLVFWGGRDGDVNCQMSFSGRLLFWYPHPHRPLDFIYKYRLKCSIIARFFDIISFYCKTWYKHCCVWVFFFFSPDNWKCFFNQTDISYSFFLTVLFF